MIQRKQTLYLLLSLIVTVVCLCMPVAMLEPQGMGLSTLIYNLGTVVPDRGISFSNWPLSALLVVTIPLEACAVFLYRKRPLQAKLCVWSIVFCLAWYVYYAFALLNGFGHEYTFHLQFAACLPLVAIIALVLARQGIIHDEKLVRSADRIR